MNSIILAILIFFIMIVIIIWYKISISQLDKQVDDLCVHLCTMGIDAQMLKIDKLQKIGAKQSFLEWFWGGGKKSMGLIQVTGKNISYINVIRRTDHIHLDHNLNEVYYYLEYLVPLRVNPQDLFRKTKLKKKRKSRFWGDIIDIEWKEGILADSLNSDLSLKEHLLTHLQQNSQLKIEIVPEPAYGFVRIETQGVQKMRPTKGLSRRWDVICFPSQSLFDCLDRIAAYLKLI